MVLKLHLFTSTPDGGELLTSLPGRFIRKARTRNRNEQQAGLKVLEKKSSHFLCQESNQKFSYVHFYSLVIMPITLSWLVGENLYYNKSVCVREMKLVITFDDSERTHLLVHFGKSELHLSDLFLSSIGHSSTQNCNQ